MVTSIEAAPDREWNEELIKRVTGDDPITARGMRQDFSDYMPQFQLIVAANHKPKLRVVDKATTRRFHILPFTVTIKEEDKDLGLPEKLKAEWPAILAWMIEGCIEWQKEKLGRPEVVSAASEEYFDEEDNVANWLAECCVVGNPKDWTGSTKLFGSWEEWANKGRLPAGSSKGLSERLKGEKCRRLGIRKQRNMKGQGFCGVRLRNRLDDDIPD